MGHGVPVFQQRDLLFNDRLCKVENILRSVAISVLMEISSTSSSGGAFTTVPICRSGGLVNVSGNPVQLQRCFHDVQKISLPLQSFCFQFHGVQIVFPRMRDLFQHDILAERVAVKIIDIDQKKLSRPQAIRHPAR
mgnify:CR=1 FL=1